MFILDLDVLAVHLDIGLALVDANDIVLRLKVVQAGLGKTNLGAIMPSKA